MISSAFAKMGREIANKLAALFTKEAEGYVARTGQLTDLMKHTSEELIVQERENFPAIHFSESDTAAPAFAATDGSELRQDSAASEPVTLTTAERRALYSYTEWDSTWINRRLRESGDFSPTEQRRIGELRSALNKLKDFRGPVIRRTNIEPETLETYQPGQTVVEKSFTSATKNPDAQFEGMDGRVEWQIDSKTGKDVSAYSDLPPEEEVLFSDGASFFVSERFIDSSGRTVIKMTQIEL
ncbi:ADP-ribosyltransferase [Nocardia tengchongensis]|uniref:ADP-ribosyltransferase n=1 Tax=Nocardia tengchongensis TaxID=2055889 RepID=UPI0036A4FB87